MPASATAKLSLIALVQRGNCSFRQKAFNLDQFGVLAIIVADSYLDSTLLRNVSSESSIMWDMAPEVPNIGPRHSKLLQTPFVMVTGQVGIALAKIAEPFGFQLNSNSIQGSRLKSNVVINIKLPS